MSIQRNFERLLMLSILTFSCQSCSTNSSRGQNSGLDEKMPKTSNNPITKEFYCDSIIKKNKGRKTLALEYYPDMTSREFSCITENLFNQNRILELDYEVSHVKLYSIYDLNVNLLCSKYYLPLHTKKGAIKMILGQFDKSYLPYNQVNFFLEYYDSGNKNFRVDRQKMNQLIDLYKDKYGEPTYIKDELIESCNVLRWKLEDKIIEIWEFNCNVYIDADEKMIRSLTLNDMKKLRKAFGHEEDFDETKFNTDPHHVVVKYIDKSILQNYDYYKKEKKEAREEKIIRSMDEI